MADQWDRMRDRAMEHLHQHGTWPVSRDEQQLEIDITHFIGAAMEPGAVVTTQDNATVIRGHLNARYSLFGGEILVIVAHQPFMGEMALATTAPLGHFHMNTFVGQDWA